MFLWLSQFSIQPVNENLKIKRQTKSQDNWMKRNEKIEYRSSQQIEGQRTTSLFTSHKKCKGSLTLEAALILPLVFFIFGILYNFFTIMNVEQYMQKVLEETSEEFAKSYYLVENLNEKASKDSRISSVFCGAFSEASATVMVKKKIQNMFGLYFVLDNGADSVSLAGSYYNPTDHTITLTASYEIRLPFYDLFGIGYEISQKAYRHVWVGRGNETSKSVQYVYVTKTGTVYHTALSCSHLNLTIREVSKKEIGNERNDSGARYKACDLCGKDPGDVLYITESGTKYHHDRNCSGLRRNVYSIPITEVGTRGLCQRCAGQ